MSEGTQKYSCPKCRQDYPVEQTRWRCDCGSFLDLNVNVEFPILKIMDRPPNLWRYRETLPIFKDDHIVTLGEGFTPLEELVLDGRSVHVKIDYLFPTGSYKDRGATVLISKARELGAQKIVEDSSGNAGSAMAAYCAKAKIPCDIYVPEGTSPGKLVQIQAYGATLKRVEGSREKTAEVAMEAVSNAFYASHCWNPFFLHGTKTFAYEVCEQLNWKSPDTIILPVGHGTLLLGTYLGFKELKEAGIVGKVPKLIGIQSAACAPLEEAFKKGEREVQPLDKQETIAEGIAIAKPVRGSQILEVIRETRGKILSVTEEEIVAALQEMGQKGYFIEPTSAATIAGLKKYGKHTKKEVIVTTLTGTGLKATEKIGHL